MSDSSKISPSAGSFSGGRLLRPRVGSGFKQSVEPEAHGGASSFKLAKPKNATAFKLAKPNAVSAFKRPTPATPQEPEPAPVLPIKLAPPKIKSGFKLAKPKVSAFARPEPAPEPEPKPEPKPEPRPEPQKISETIDMLMADVAGYLKSDGESADLTEIGLVLSKRLASYWQSRRGPKEIELDVKRSEKASTAAQEYEHGHIRASSIYNEMAADNGLHTIEKSLHILLSMIGMMNHISGLEDDDQKEEYLKFVEKKMEEVRGLLPENAFELVVLADRISHRRNMLSPADEIDDDAILEETIVDPERISPDITLRLKSSDLEIVEEDDSVADSDVPFLDADDLVEEEVDVSKPPPPPIPVAKKERGPSLVEPKMSLTLGEITPFFRRGCSTEDWANAIGMIVDERFGGNWEDAGEAAKRYGFVIDAWRIDSERPADDRVDLLSAQMADKIYKLARAGDGFGMNDVNARGLSILYALRYFFLNRESVGFRVSPQNLIHASDFLESIGHLNRFIPVDGDFTQGRTPHFVDRLAYQIEHGFKELAPFQLTVDMVLLWTRHLQQQSEGSIGAHNQVEFYKDRLIKSVEQLLGGKLESAASAHNIDWKRIDHIDFGKLDVDVVKWFHHLARASLLKEAAMGKELGNRSQLLREAMDELRGRSIPPVYHRETISKYASDLIWNIVWQDLSPIGQTLVEDVSQDLPSDNSIAGVQRLTSYLAQYWQKQSGKMKRGDRGDIELDYARLLNDANDAIRQGLEMKYEGSIGRKKELLSLVAKIKQTSDDLNAGRIPDYVPSLAGQPSLCLIQAFQDLARAMLLYKATWLLADKNDVAQRKVMLTSSMDAVTSALSWFKDTAVPNVITNYAKLIRLKITIETQKLGNGGQGTPPPLPPLPPLSGAIRGGMPSSSAGQSGLSASAVRSAFVYMGSPAVRGISLRL